MISISEDANISRDRKGEGGCDVGVGACRSISGDAAADALAAILHARLQEALPEYVIDPRPRLQGCWRSVPRYSLTQSTAALGYASVQMELGYTLRRDLARDPALLKRMAAAFLECAPACVEAVCGARAVHGAVAAEGSGAASTIEPEVVGVVNGE